MNVNQPLVSIGIPTYNRAELLKRSIESALIQDYENIEVIVSDNDSTDDTRAICQFYRDQDVRLKYIRQRRNVGPSANFDAVLKEASGQYFMWLGDDDWIDVSYVSHCMSVFTQEPDVALVSGAPIYYRHGLKAYAGRVFNLCDGSWILRVARYYMKVADNGTFYGVMRTAQLQQISILNVMGGDWHLIANIASIGKVRMSAAVSVHRELGGATTSYRQIAKSLGLPMIQAILPMTTIAFGAWKNIVHDGKIYKNRSLIIRFILADIVFFIIILKSARGFAGQVKSLLKQGAQSVVNVVSNK